MLGAVDSVLLVLNLPLVMKLAKAGTGRGGFHHINWHKLQPELLFTPLLPGVDSCTSIPHP